jgi:hypothetical protein
MSFFKNEGQKGKIVRVVTSQKGEDIRKGCRRANSVGNIMYSYMKTEK